jgi:hypothetical protein
MMRNLRNHHARNPRHGLRLLHQLSEANARNLSIIPAGTVQAVPESATKAEKIQAALAVLGKQLTVEVCDAA